MAEAFVNPRLLVWARERASFDVGAMAAALDVSQEKVTSWESGASRPSFTHAEKWASVTHVAFGMLYAPKPPLESPPPPDFRTVEGKTHQPSLAFRDLYQDVQFKHDWYRHYRVSEGFDAVPFVQSLRPQVSPSTLATAMRTTLKVSREGVKASDEYFRRLVAAAEAAGVWVMRSSTVGADTHRSLKPDEFRGFAIADPIAPLVFVNVADAPNAQLFTLVHELAHLWLGKSGVSDPLAPTADAAERLCNAAAAEFLVPGAELQRHWRKRDAAEEQFVVLAREFKVSAAVVAIRAREVGLASNREVDAFLEKQRSAWKHLKKKSSGGNYYTTLMTRNGREFARAVLAEASSRNLLLRDAGELLNMHAAKVMTAARREGLG